MPETNGRYQSAWIITDEHYNPMAFVKPGSYTLTQENVGRRYAMIAIRTQVNVADPADLAIVHKLQDHPCRFDAVIVALGAKADLTIRHYENAFRAKRWG